MTNSNSTQIVDSWRSERLFGYDRLAERSVSCLAYDSIPSIPKGMLPDGSFDSISFLHGYYADPFADFTIYSTDPSFRRNFTPTHIVPFLDNTENYVFAAGFDIDHRITFFEATTFGNEFLNDISHPRWSGFRSYFILPRRDEKIGFVSSTVMPEFEQAIFIKPLFEFVSTPYGITLVNNRGLLNLETDIQELLIGNAMVTVSATSPVQRGEYWDFQSVSFKTEDWTISYQGNRTLCLSENFGNGGYVIYYTANKTEGAVLNPGSPKAFEAYIDLGFGNRLYKMGNKCGLVVNTITGNSFVCALQKAEELFAEEN